jgi:hypothetical protein
MEIESSALTSALQRIPKLLVIKDKTRHISTLMMDKGYQILNRILLELEFLIVSKLEKEIKYL